MRSEIENILNNYAIKLHAYSNGKPGHHNDYREQTDLANEALTNLFEKMCNEARIDELKAIELAQQDYDKWSGFCMDDTSDFGNYITDRIAALKTKLGDTA